MPENILFILYSYLAIISFIAMVATIIDKRAAKRNAQRISERTLILLSLFGGSVSMLLTMRIIRHKTKHAKFMVGIPIIIVLQIAAAAFWGWWAVFR